MITDTAGQAAYEAFRRVFPDKDWGSWMSLDIDLREGWEDIGRAVIDWALLIGDESGGTS